MAKKRSPRDDAPPRRIVRDPARKPARQSKTDAERLDDVLKKSGPRALDVPAERKRTKD